MRNDVFQKTQETRITQMNVILLNAPTLVMKELHSVLDKRAGIKLVSLGVPRILDPKLVHEVFEKIQQYLPALFFHNQ